MTLLIRSGLVMSSADTAPAPMDVLIEGNRITAVGPSLGAPPHAQVIDAAGHLVTPGFVNAHTHGRESLIKGFVDNRPLELWFQQLAALSDERTPRDQYVAAMLGAIEMLKSGVTAAYDLFTNIPVVTPETIHAVLSAYDDAGMRAIVAPCINDIPFHRTMPGFAERVPPPLMAELDRLLPPANGADQLKVVRDVATAWTARADDRVRVGVAPVNAERCTTNFLVASRDLAAERRLPLHMHFVETKVQRVQRLRSDGCTTATYLDRLGMLGPNTTLAHAVWTTEDDIEIIARAGAHVVHNPASNLKLGSGLMPMRRMLERGVPLSIGTDGSACSDNQNIFEAIRLAAYLHRPFEPDYEHWPRAPRILQMAWEGGADALGLPGQLGRIAPGYLADVVLLDLDAETLTPLNNAANQLVMCETGAAVRTVIVNGRVVLRDGRCSLIDDVAIKAEARAAAQRLSGVNRTRMSAVTAAEPFLRAAREDVLT